MTLSQVTVGALVRIDPRDGMDHSRHWGRGRVLAVRGHRVVVQVFPRHRRPLLVDPGRLKVWKAQETQRTVPA